MMSASLVPFEVEDRWAKTVEEESPAEGDGEADKMICLHDEPVWEKKQGIAIVNTDEHF